MLDEDGRHVRYQFTLRPWLHLATLETDCRTFQNKTVVEILDELLADYPFVVEKRLRKTYPARDFQNQFNESDFAFFERLCQEWGLSYHFEHGDDKQRLVIGDAMGAYRPGASAACQTIDYHPPGWKTDAEYIHSFTPACASRTPTRAPPARHTGRSTCGTAASPTPDPPACPPAISHSPGPAPPQVPTCGAKVARWRCCE